MAQRTACLLVCALALGGCGAHVDETTEASGGAPPGCPTGEYLRDDGSCAPEPGLPPDMECPPGEWSYDGACMPAGIPPDLCSPGFVHDGDRGCEPILPPAPCPEGQMAVPGEMACHEIAPCGAPPWGDLALEQDTEYVDQNFSGASDGSAAAPWTTIQQGVDAAAPGAIVAIAAGSYAEDVVIEGKPVRLWGRCPQLVELKGTPNPQVAALFINSGGKPGGDVRRIAIASQGLGLAITDTYFLDLEEAWIHDNAARGIEVVDFDSLTQLFVTGSLLEHNRDVGILAIEAWVIVEASVVRDTLPDALGEGGRGLSLQQGGYGSVRGSLLERNHEIGVFVSASELDVWGAVVRDTLPDAHSEGHGIGIEDVPVAAIGPEVHGSLLERNHGVGITVYNSHVYVGSTVIRDTMSNTQGARGQAITVSDDTNTGSRSTLELGLSLLERNQESGVLVYGSEAIVWGVAVRNSLPNGQGNFGRGIAVQLDPASGARSSIQMEYSLLEHNVEVGLFVGGSDATVQGTAVRDTLVTQLSAGGQGIHVEDHSPTGTPGSLELTSSLVETSREGGLVVVGAATAKIETSLILDTQARDGYLGDGVIVWSDGALANATITGTRIEASERAAISSFGGGVALSTSHLVCQAFDLAAEQWDGLAATFQDLGNVRCGCPTATEHCQAQGHALEPPPPLEP